MNNDWIVTIEWTGIDNVDKTNTDHLKLSDDKVNPYSDNLVELGNKLLSDKFECTEQQLSDKALLKSIKIVRMDV